MLTRHYGMLSRKTIFDFMPFSNHIFLKNMGAAGRHNYGIYGVVEDDILSILWNFGFSSIRPFSVRGLRSYYIKAKGWIIKMAVNKPFLYQFWWNLVCSLLLEPHLHRKIFSKVVKAKSQKVARSKGQNSKNFLLTIWVKTKALLMVLHQFSS